MVQKYSKALVNCFNNVGTWECFLGKLSLMFLRQVRGTESHFEWNACKCSLLSFMIILYTCTALINAALLIYFTCSSACSCKLRFICMFFYLSVFFLTMCKFDVSVTEIRIPSNQIIQSYTCMEINCIVRNSSGGKHMHNFSLSYI